MPEGMFTDPAFHVPSALEPELQRLQLDMYTMVRRLRRERGLK